MKPIAHVSLLVLSLCASAITLPATEVVSSSQTVAPTAATVILPPPDPCVSTQIQLNPEPWPSEDFTVLGASAGLFEAGPSSNAGAPPLRHDPSVRPLVLIVDGNGFSLSDYDDLAGYLAVKGFNVVVILPADQRPNGQHQSVMATVKIPLTSFSNINKGAIQTVLFAFPAGSRGTLLIDSVEWFKE